MTQSLLPRCAAFTLVCSLATVLGGAAPAHAADIAFERQTIDGEISIGYGLALGRVDADDLVDILLADKQEIVWYQNPGKAGEAWTKHVIARGLTSRDNVCLAARDLDGDGLVEIAVGADWNPGETSDAASSGALFQLKRPQDPTRPWNVVPITPHEPTTHRMHFIKSAEGMLLAVLPLHGVDNKSGNGDNRVSVSLFDLGGKAPRLVRRLDTGMHMTHNFEILTDPQAGEQEFLLVAGKQGYAALFASGEKHTLVENPQSKGAGEVRRYPVGPRVFVGIEPMHGTDVALYRSTQDGAWSKEVLDTTLAQGHALAAGDLFGSATPEVVAGWRNPNAARKVGIKIYHAVEGKWKSHVLDDNHTACEDLKLADLDGDGKLDLLAAGRKSKNVVVYWNQSK